MKRVSRLVNVLLHKSSDQSPTSSWYKDFPFLHKQKKSILPRIHETPFFAIDRSIVYHRLKTLQKALEINWGENFGIAYSFKTNYELVRSKILHPDNIWAEVVSSREYALARELEFAKRSIIFNGPVKRDSELLMAMRQGALVQIDNKNELLRSEKIASTLKRPIGIGLRINGPIDALHDSRFGFSVKNNDALQAVQQIRDSKFLKLKSLHFHAGSDLDNIQIYNQMARHLALFTNTAVSILEYPISYLDAGGGFPASGRKPMEKHMWNPQDISDYIAAITATLKKTLHHYANTTLIVEPGRYLSDDAVIFVTKVFDRKDEAGKQLVLTDGAITKLPLVDYRPPIIRVFNKNLNEHSSAKTIYSYVYGATCQERDILYVGKLPKIEVGDIIVYCCVGAYNQSMGSDFILGKTSTYIM